MSAMKIYTADYLVTQNDTRDIIPDAALAIDGPRVADLGPAADVLPRHPDASVDALGHAVILPGLINAHTHLPMAALRGISDDKPLLAWLTEDIFPLEARWEPALLRTSALLSCAELLRTGTTAFYDMYMLQENTFAAADTAGLRGVLGENLTHFFPQLGGSSLDEIFGRLRSLADAWRGHPRLRGAVTPHAVYTTDPDLLTAARALTDELSWGFGMHMSETRRETADCLRDFHARPIPYCDSLGILRPGTALFHCVDVDDDDIAILRSRQCAAVHNPASNMKLASGAAPVARLLSAGVPVALGTDGPASENAQNLFREIWLAALLGKLSASDPTAISAQTALDMATRHGAAAIGDPLAGTLAPGSHADFCALDLTSPNLQPVHHILSTVVYAAAGLENTLTVVDGRECYRDGRFLTFDYPALLAEAASLRRWAASR